MSRINKIEKYVTYSAASAAALALSIGGAACGGKSLSTSPETHSIAYPGDPHAFGSDPANWPDAIVADVQLQEPITNADVILGFEKPGTNDFTVKEFSVDSTDPTESGKFLLRLGPQSVEFEVRLRGSKGSRITKVAPTVTFEGPELVTEAKKIPGIRLGGATGWEH